MICRNRFIRSRSSRIPIEMLLKAAREAPKNNHHLRNWVIAVELCGEMYTMP